MVYIPPITAVIFVDLEALQTRLHQCIWQQEIIVTSLIIPNGKVYYVEEDNSNFEYVCFAEDDFPFFKHGIMHDSSPFSTPEY